MRQMTTFDYPLDPPTFETRREAHEKVDKQKRYNQILTILSEVDKPMSAKEIAIEMKRRGYSYSDERNVSAPRITELLKMGKVDCKDESGKKLKKVCEYTGATVTVYRLRS